MEHRGTHSGVLQAHQPDGELGCAEFPLIIKQADVTIRAFDTTLLHSQMAVALILGKQALGRAATAVTSGRK